MSIRTWILVAYCIALPLANLWILSRNAVFSPTFVAARDLPANRLLQPGDVKPASIDDRYLRYAISEGGSIRPRTMAPTPRTMPHKGFLPVALPIKRSSVESDDLNVGTSFDLCNGDALVVGAATVQAVVCAEREPNCILIADVPTDGVTNLVAALADLEPSPLIDNVSKTVRSDFIRAGGAGCG